MESLVSTLAGALKVEMPKHANTLSEIRRWLRTEVNWLVERDHEKLKEILYRVDVDEDFLISALAAHPEEKVDVLTDLIISRQMQKMESRTNNPQPPATDPNEAL